MAPEASRPLMCADSATPRPRRRRCPTGVAAAASGSRQPDSRSTMSRHSARPFEPIGWPPNQGRRRARACSGDAARSDRCRAAPAISSSCVLGGEGHLRHAEAAERAEAQLVGVGDAAMARERAGMRYGPQLHQQRVAEHARAVVAVGAAVEQHLDLARDQRAVALGAGLDADRERMARAHRSRNPPRASGSA